MDWEIIIEYIKWIDPHSIDEWSDVDDIKMTDQVVISVGQVIREDKERIMMSLNRSDGELDDSVSCTMIIPKRCIVERRNFKWKMKMKK